MIRTCKLFFRWFAVASMMMFLTCGAAVAAPTIRILTAYTSDALAGYQSIQVFNNAINIQISNLNDALRYSGVALSVQSVGTTALGASYNNKSPTEVQSIVINDTLLKSLRDSSGADVVMVLTYTACQTCGYSGGALLTSQGFATPALAFATADVSAFANYVYEHEFAHLLGARHQSAGGFTGNDSSRSVGHGYYIRLQQTNGYPNICENTIEALAPTANLNGISCTSSTIHYFSNPLIKKDYACNNLGCGYRQVPLGASNANNAAVINANAAAVAEFHATKIGLAIPAVASVILNLLLVASPD